MSLQEDTQCANTLLEAGKSAALTGKPILTLQVGAQSDRGTRRRSQPNEDSLFSIQGMLPSTVHQAKPFALFAVADGVGGQAHGQEASQMAGHALIEYVRNALSSQPVKPEAVLSVLVAGVEHANRTVYQRNWERGTDMGTTLTAVLVVENTAYVAHVGDSRLYLYHQPEGLSQITRDHSLVAALVEAKIIEPGDVYSHPLRNQIYRCLGERAVVMVETCSVPLATGDTLLLCSDGLWEMVRDAQIADIVASPPADPSITARKLIQAALAGGGEDNASVLTVRVHAE